MEILNKSRILNILYRRHKDGFLALKNLPDPFTFKDMQKGIERTYKAIKSGEKIVVIGDYDVDGVVATTILIELFKKIDYPIEWVVPNRFKDGYGISKGLVEQIDADLIITVDNGIVAFEAANYCKSRGIDLIITDHHSVDSELPTATAIINQKQQDCKFIYKEICGSQIAWYFSAALARRMELKNFNSKELLDLVALAIVADVMPLTHINRTMLIAGLQQIREQKRAFIKVIMEKNEKLKNITSETIAFYIAPLINSAGRLEDASIAVEFLSTEDIERARELFDKLSQLNEERKEIERELTQKAIREVNPTDNIAIVWGDDWNEGVVGIVASRVANHFKMPAIVLSCDGDICKGSGRSYGDCNLFALASKAKDFYLKFGGHKMALGLSLNRESLPIVKSILNIEAKECNREYLDKAILGILPFREIDYRLIDILERFEPYGEGNPRPKFFARDAKVVNSNNVGKNGEYVRYTLEQDGIRISAIDFRRKEHIESGKYIDFIFTVSRNSYNGKDYINVQIEDITHIRSRKKY